MPLSRWSSRPETSHRLSVMRARCFPSPREGATSGRRSSVTSSSGMIKVGKGLWDEATSHLENGLAVNRRVHDDGNTPAHWGVVAWLECARGRYGAALEVGWRAWEAALKQGHAEWTAWSAIYLGSLLLDLGAYEEGRHLGPGRRSGRAL